MSVIIKGVEMPSKCRFCPCCADNGLIGMQREYFCSAVDSALEIDNLDQKLSACPLKEVPTLHGRLIDADAFLKWLKEFHPNDVAIMSGIKNARTIVEAEVSE